ncbi:MAG: hypothetical protein DCF26_07705 [Burkholderiales bacterium]|nr:MAG: hypothetical protein DCF26_07705 [Burkholderiales bacterium]
MPKPAVTLVRNTQLAKRLPQFNSLAQASAVVLSGGTNDLLEKKPSETVTTAWTSILNQIPAQVRVLCIGIPEPAPSTSLAGRIIEANQAIQRLCLSRGHLFIAVQPQQAGDWLEARLTADGIHLDQSGQLMLIRKINSALKGKHP